MTLKEDQIRSGRTWFREERVSALGKEAQIEGQGITRGERKGGKRRKVGREVLFAIFLKWEKCFVRKWVAVARLPAALRTEAL
jgi:hypothetical protein